MLDLKDASLFESFIEFLLFLYGYHCYLQRNLFKLVEYYCTLPDCSDQLNVDSEGVQFAEAITLG